MRNTPPACIVPGRPTACATAFQSMSAAADRVATPAGAAATSVSAQRPVARTFRTLRMLRLVTSVTSRFVRSGREQRLIAICDLGWKLNGGPGSAPGKPAHAVRLVPVPGREGRRGDPG